MAARKSGKPLPTFDIEREECRSADSSVCGVDEAGRGPLAGPVVAAAVCIPANALRVPLPDELRMLNDSKAISEELRSDLFVEVTGRFAYGVGIADVDRIDRDNILQATLWAMRTAVSSLETQPDVALVDGNRDPKLDCRSRLVIGGDAKCLSIAAASVIAKVTRDRIMEQLGEAHPDYGFAQNKGYGTKAHLDALKLHGPTTHHRRSFRPVRLAMGLEEE